MTLDNITIGNIKVDKRFKQEKSNNKRNCDFARFPYGRDYKYRWHNNGLTEHLSLKCSILGCKFGGFVNIFDTYSPEIREDTFKNGRQDAALVPN